MKSGIITRFATFGIALALGFATAEQLYADSPAEMLQRGIHQEETLGNLDQAIEIGSTALSTRLEECHQAVNDIGNSLLVQ